MSLIIFGWGKTKVKEYGSVVPLTCEHCHNHQGWILKEISIWSTLFFISIFPYKVDYILCCPICLYGYKLNRHKFNKLIPIAQANMDYFTHKITQEQHEAKMKQLGYWDEINFSKDLINKKE